MTLGRPYPLSDFQFPHLSHGDKLNSQGCANGGIINVEMLGKHRIPAGGKESRLVLGTASPCDSQVSITK